MEMHEVRYLKAVAWFTARTLYAYVRCRLEIFDSVLLVCNWPHSVGENHFF
jgi:hypothetical protein